MLPRTKSEDGFNLVEVLIVIAIIAVLMALLFPADGGGMTVASKAIAKNDVTQIANAIMAYQTEYGQFPTSAVDGHAAAVSGIFLNALMGTNARGIVFIEVETWKKDRGGVNPSGAYLDPWSNPYNYVVTTNSTLTVSGTTIRKSVAVYNTPAKDANSNRHIVRSWE